MQPENKIFTKHDLDKIATESLIHNEVQLRLEGLSDALENPDSTEELDVSVLASRENPLVKIDNYLSVYKKLTLGEPIGPGAEAPAKIEIFKPYEKVVSEEHLGTEFATSIISADLYESYMDNRQPVGKLVLFKLDHSAGDVTAKDIVIGSNCVYGAIIINGEINPFSLNIANNGDRVIQEVQRKDSTEENGISVEARLVEKNDFQKLELHSLDIDDDAEEYLEVMAELDKFINHRKNSNQQKDTGDAYHVSGFYTF